MSKLRRDLLPCPFCGSPAALSASTDFVACVSCPAEMWADSVDELYTFWYARRLVKLDPFNVSKPGDDIVIEQTADDVGKK